MTIKTTLFAAILALTPGLAMAVGCNNGEHDQAMTCAEGSAYDAESGSCKPVVTG